MEASSFAFVIVVRQIHPAEFMPPE